MILAKSFPYLRLKPLGLSMNHMVEQLKFVHRTEISLPEIGIKSELLLRQTFLFPKTELLYKEILLVK